MDPETSIAADAWGEAGGRSGHILFAIQLLQGQPASLSMTVLWISRPN